MAINITLTHQYEDFQRLETEWTSLLENSHAFGAALTWPWINIWLKHFSNEGELWLLQARDETSNRLLGIAPLFKIRVSPKYGTSYRQIEFVGASHHQENLDFIIQPGYEEQIIPKFLDMLYQHKNAWDVILISSLDNPKTAKALSSSGFKWERNERWEMISPYMDLPANPEEWMQSLSKNRRWKLRRYHRALDETYGENWEIRSITTKEELDKVFDVLVKHHQANWETKGKAGAFKYGNWTDYYRELMYTLFDQGWLRLNCLCLNGRSEVSLFSYHYASRAYNLISGYNKDITDIPIGHVMTHFSIELAIREGLHKYHFMWGEESYKYSFGGVDRTLQAFEHVRNPFIKFQKDMINFLKNLRKIAENDQRFRQYSLMESVLK
ncbi:MAG: GNAT family N-acetyltransferase [Anaerolineales bacterium]